MADDKLQNGGKTPEERRPGEGKKDEQAQFSDLGNLPPLSDFESSQGASDSGLPPLGKFDSDGSDSLGGLPPISEITVETPKPTGGNIKPAPPGFETPPPKWESGLDTPLSDSGFATPGSFQGTGFQDLTADSDFSPETPEATPQFASDFETPMFDSAFGVPSMDSTTSVPTQAMETPLFGANGNQSGPGAGFDPNAFSGRGDTGGFNMGGTPMPDFSPDTARPTQPATPPPVGPVRAPAARSGGGGGVGILVAIIFLIAGLAVGIFIGPMVTNKALPMLPMNPWKVELEKSNSEVTRLNSEVKRLRDIVAKAEETGSTAEVSTDELERLQAEITQVKAQRDELVVARDAVQGELDKARQDLEAKQAQYLKAQEDYDRLMGQYSIVSARRDGLLSEVERLQDHVGTLEQADLRSQQTKKALELAVTQLSVTVREGLPLTPARYDYQTRVDAVNALISKVSAAKWVDPSVLDEYTKLYLKELEVARSTEYFFAKVPVTDRFGNSADIWAECVMNGNWSVYYRTIDGKNIGVYRNITTDGGVARYDFVPTELPEMVKQIEQSISDNRVPGYEDKLRVLAEKQLQVDDRTQGQRIFDSL